MAVVEVSVTKASIDFESGCKRGVACKRMALHFLKALSRAAVHVMGCEFLALGPDRMSWSGA